MKGRQVRILAVVAFTLLVAGALFTGAAPYIYAEYALNLQGEMPTIQPQPAVPVRGQWMEDYFLMQQLDSSTIAIGEPRYYQGNYSYLIIGARAAVLFDAGSGLRDLEPLVRSLTSLPVTVVPSHLHFDHVGALGHFDKTALLDVGDLRARTSGGALSLTRYEFLGFADRLPRKTFSVNEWWAPDSILDLGGRRLRVLAAPGHTPSSVALLDEQRHQLFAGDFIYPGHLYAFLPGSRRRAYLQTTARLLKLLPADVRIFCAHMEDPAELVQAPELHRDYLVALQATLIGIRDGTLQSEGIYPRIFPVRGKVNFATGWRFNNR
jgi:glyoxylase-like metal-dependent hydrolase (beta-lactamase superfamily II)